MIEWVPIKDWKFGNWQLCIIAYSRKSMPGFFALICKESDLKEYNTGDWKVTHIAPVNPPVEKTLEEKFELEFPFHDKNYYIRLAKTAKEHYEVEK
jgi:hypothetical protein